MTTISYITSPSRAAARGTSSLVRAITLAGLVIAIQNGLEATTFAVLTLSGTPVTFFQYIASALLGPAAFAGGYTTMLLGSLMHLVVSFVVAGVFILAASKIALVRRTVFASAPLYGAAVAIISGVLLPFTAAPKLPVTTMAAVHGVIADAAFVGLPLVMVVWLGARTGRDSIPA